MYLCNKGIEYASFNDFYIGFFNCPDSVVFFCFSFHSWQNLQIRIVDIIVLLRDVFHIGLVIGPRPTVLAWGAAEHQYSRPRTYN